MGTTIIAVSLGLGVWCAGGYSSRTFTHQQVAVTVQATPLVDPACEEARRLLDTQTFRGLDQSSPPQGRLPNLSQ